MSSIKLLSRHLALAALAAAMLARPDAARAEEQEQEQVQAQEDPNRHEWAVLPVLGGNSDIGFLFGGIFVLARMREGYDPYRWRALLQLAASVKEGPDRYELPVHEDILVLDMPDLLDDRLRLYSVLGFTKNIIAGYYGLGNASSARARDTKRGLQYGVTRPFIKEDLRISLGGPLSIVTSVGFAYYVFDIYPGSKLEQDIDAAAQDSDAGSALTPDNRPFDSSAVPSETLYGIGSHGRLGLALGLVYDSRDDETYATRGSFTELAVRGSPGVLTGAEHLYLGWTASTRVFAALHGEHLVLALRACVDLLHGRVPFYELAEVGGLAPFNALGGAHGVRGVPAGRYHGKLKILGNLELRSVFYRFDIVSHRFALGAGLFFDSGRLWSDIPPRSDLDGSGVELKFGTGGGLRIHWGDTVVIRFDVAYSPDARPVAIYLDLGQAF